MADILHPTSYILHLTSYILHLADGCFMADEGLQVPPVPASRSMHLQYYLLHSGQWDYAEAYNVIVLNPRAADTAQGNAFACWTEAYDRNSPQLTTVQPPRICRATMLTRQELLTCPHHARACLAGASDAPLS